MSTKHTPGPWVASKPDGLAHWNIRAGQLCIANVPDFIGSAVTMEHVGQGGANARLIASAPDLLEALNVAEAALYRLNGSDDLPGWLSGAVVNIRAAIAKAKGRA